MVSLKGGHDHLDNKTVKVSKHLLHTGLFSFDVNIISHSSSFPVDTALTLHGDKHSTRRSVRFFVLTTVNGNHRE